MADLVPHTSATPPPSPPQRGNGIPGRHETLSFTLSSETAQVIKYTLHNAEPLDFCTNLYNAVDKMRPDDQDALLSALEKAGFVMHQARTAVGHTELRHCVRCHSDYFERDNGLSSCKHIHWAPKPIYAGNAHVEDEYLCCKKSVIKGQMLPGWCLKRHTTREDLVVYDPAMNILTCAQRQCRRA